MICERIQPQQLLSFKNYEDDSFENKRTQKFQKSTIFGNVKNLHNLMI